MRKIIACFTLLVTVIGCSSQSSESGQKMDNETRVKMEQYMVAGETLYSQYCSNCHQMDGNGLAELYPPLTASDYLTENRDELACIIKNGKQGEIVVNGVTYNQIMPGLNMLTDLEIAEIATYVSNAWTNDLGFVGVNEVSSALRSCE